MESVPGFSFVLAREDHLSETERVAGSLSLDLLAQYRELERSGQFRFTPPTHALMAFDQALDELEAEGGIAGRTARHRANHAMLIAGMGGTGFCPYLEPEDHSIVVTTFYNPVHPDFDFDQF